MSRPHIPVELRFWQKVDKSTGGCWLWTRAIDPSTGYGRVHVGGTSGYAHRVAYELTNGPIPAGMMVDHKCRNRGCVNPDHLRIATNKQNAENLATVVSSKSGVRGVTFYKPRGTWVAKVRHNGRMYYAGYHKTIDAAEAAVIQLRNRLFTHNDLDRMAS